MRPVDPAWPLEKIQGISLKQALENIQKSHAEKSSPSVFLQGCEGALPALLVAQLAKSLPQEQHPLLVLVPTEEQALRWTRDVAFFLGSRESSTEVFSVSEAVVHIPAPGFLPWDEVLPDRALQMQRMVALFRLSQEKPPLVLVASVSAFHRRVVPKSAFAAGVDLLQAEQEINREQTIRLLQRGGYTRTPVCEDPGTFSVHGGILDVFVPLYSYPVRIELFGDLIESLRLYDPTTQRVLRSTDEVVLHPIQENILTPGNHLRERVLAASDLALHPSGRTRDLLEQMERGEHFLGIETLLPAYHNPMASLAAYLPNTKVCYIDHPLDCQEQWMDELVQAEVRYQKRIEEHKLAFPPNEFYFTWEEWEKWQHSRQIFRMESGGLQINPNMPTLCIGSTSHQDVVVAIQQAQQQKTSLLAPWAERLRAQQVQGMHTTLVVSSLSHGERLQEMLLHYDVPVALHRPGVAQLAALQQSGHDLQPWDVLSAPSTHLIEIRVGTLTCGFDLPVDRISLYAEAEIFGEKTTRPTTKVKPKRNQPEWTAGTLVVHVLHGIGRYQGFVKLPIGNQSLEVVHIQYDGGSLYLPVWRLHELQPYQGAETSLTKVDKLGGETWQKTKSKVSKEVQQLAEQLLQVYAQRQALPGTSHHLNESAEEWFHEFEATFPYEETPDQQKAIDDVLADLEAEHPMDRLVCGDVGYGKTEVALRAAMKVALSGQQVALLAPTTVLVEQHAARFQERLAKFPVVVESLSRFRSRKEQTDILKGLDSGQIDVVIGTHRLLSADVRFQRLGLLIIDEEQRFGVAHKERLRQLRTQIDTLTLTATPIPRTLNMAMSGMREISLLTTPPEDRLAVRTLVARESDTLIREAILTELHRGGQVFFVHNRIETIGKWARRLQELLPDIRIGVGHGQLSPEVLEQVMLDFVSGNTHLLLCTTIIENGIDIPRANTMIIDRADTFGLSQLYQLRGRIGRSKERAFCYLLVPPQETMSAEAKQRLLLLQRFTELGAGFQIASYDLELRGAGELLGNKQSGNMLAVGFDMYTQMLQEAIAALRGQPIQKTQDIDLNCDLPAYLPEDYIADPGQRIEWYRRLAGTRHEEELTPLVQELTERYGSLPKESQLLCKVMLVKHHAQRLHATSIEISQSRLALALGKDTPLSPSYVLELLGKPKSPWRLTPDMRLSRSWISSQEKQNRLDLTYTLLQELLLHMA